MNVNRRRVVCIGGGTGLSTMLRGLKKYDVDLTAVVTVADNGGGSGMLRRDMNILPPGDIRNCLLALADMEPMMEKVLQYRFTDGQLAGQSFGNLFLAALAGVYDSFEIGVEKANEILAVSGKVIPVTTEDVELEAEYIDGKKVVGEYEIVQQNKTHRKKIKNIRLLPSKPVAYYKAIEAIKTADLIILGPGSLYTSVIPNLLVEGIGEAIKAATGKVFYVSNIMTQLGETDGYALSDHIESLERYLGEGVIGTIIMNNGTIDKSILKEYKLKEGTIPVVNDLVFDEGYRVVEAPIVKISRKDRWIRHDEDQLAELLNQLM